MKLLPALMLLLPLTVWGQRPESPTDKHFWYTTTTTAPVSGVWEIWTDVPNWSLWDAGLQEATLAGPFVLGAKGTIVSDGRKSKFTVVALTPGKSYTIKTKLPLGGLYVRRLFTETAEGNTITHEVWFKGLTSGVFARALGRNFRAMLPAVVEKVKEIAEQ